MVQSANQESLNAVFWPEALFLSSSFYFSPSFFVSPNLKNFVLVAILDARERLIRHVVVD